MYTEGIELEHFSSTQNADKNSSTISCQRHAVFQYFLSGDSKQDAATTTAHSKRLISFIVIDNPVNDTPVNDRPVNDGNVNDL